MTALLTSPNAVSIMAVVATVLIVAFDHRKWAQSGHESSYMPFVWAIPLTLACIHVPNFGTGSYVAAIAPAVMALIVFGVGFALRRRAKQHTSQPETSPASARSEGTIVYNITSVS